MNNAAVLFQVIGQNLLGFDLLIFLVAGVNTAVYVLARRAAGTLYHTLNRTIFLPEHRGAGETLGRALDSVREADLVDMRKRAERLYNVFINLTGIFPLLGILGTVIALLPMVAELSSLQLNFFAALTSTFWGLVFAIIFKVLDGFLAARMEDNDKNVALFLERNPNRSGGGACAKEES